MAETWTQDGPWNRLDFLEDFEGIDLAWLQLLFAVTICVATLCVSGPVLARLWGFRGLYCWLVGVPLGFAFFGVSGVMAGFLHVRWGGWFVLAFWAVLAVLGIVLRRRNEWVFEVASDPVKTLSMKWTFIGVVVAATVYGVRLVNSMEEPNLVAQFWDTPFQSNQTWWMLETGQASSLSPVMVGRETHSTPYPLGWQNAAAVVSQASGMGVAFGNNALLLVTYLIVWPLGVGLLMSLLLKDSRAGFIGATVSGVLPQFPALLAWWALSPNMLAYALMVYTLGIAVVFFTRPSSIPLLVSLGSFAVAFVGTALVQPNAVIALVFFVGMMLAIQVGQKVWSTVQGGRPKKLTLASLAVIGVICLIALLDALTMVVPRIKLMRTEATWEARSGIRDAALDVLLGRASYAHTPYIGGEPISGGIIPVMLSVLVLIGAVFALTRFRTAWLVLAYAFSAGLFIVTMRVNGPMRSYLTGYWYGDPERLAALLGVFGTILISVALFRLAGLVRKSQTQVMVVAAVVTMFAAQLSPYMTVAHQKIRLTYSFDGEFLSENDMRLLESIDQYVPEGQGILGDPWDGSLFVPTYSERAFSAPYWQVRNARELEYLAQNLAQAETDPKVCQILEDKDLQFAIILEGRIEDESPLQDSMRELVASGGAVSLKQVGDAELMEMTVCE